MKHPKDQQTMNMLGEPKRRGRPPKEDALTPAQRQARYRAKQRIAESRKRVELREAQRETAKTHLRHLGTNLSGYLHEKQFGDLSEYDAEAAKQYWLEIGRRMGWISVT